MEFRLKKLRQERNISQLKLALDLNMNQNTISRYESMEREADYETLIKFADYFGVSLDYLLGRSENKQDQLALAAELGYGCAVEIGQDCSAYTTES